MMTLPFLCLGIGFAAGVQKSMERFAAAMDTLMNLTLVVLMLTIGMNMGINPAIMMKLETIGFNCLVIALSAIVFSVLLTYIAEKTILPLENVRQKLLSENIDLSGEVVAGGEVESAGSPLVWIMPVSIVAGVGIGYFILPQALFWILGHLLTGALVFLYVGVGISLGVNRHVLKYLQVLGVRVLVLPLAIFVGSLVGGWLAGLVLNLPAPVAVISSGGMSYYSLTGAYMTKVLGLEAGTYGFVVNVFREFLTVLLLPLLIRISKGSPLAGGAAGNMDTMLMPVTKFVGPELGLVTLVTGTTLTFAVPFILPVLEQILR